MTARLKSMYKAAVFAALSVGMMVCASCSDEETTQRFNETSQVNFGVSIAPGGWNTSPRAQTSEYGQKKCEAFRFENSEMWVIATTEENADTALFKTSGSRAAAVTTDNFSSSYTSFGVFAYTYTDAGEGQLYINGDEATLEGEGIWGFTPTRYWPGSAYQIKFFAYAPYRMNPKITDPEKCPTISYNVSSDISKQEDLLVAVSDDEKLAPGNNNATWPLTFKHILTAINVRASDALERTITKVTLSGVKGSGTYTFGNTEWTASGDDQSFTCDVEKTLSETVTDVTSDNDGTTFMMIPQVLEENARLEVTLSDNTTLSGSLNGKKWPMGSRITYIISDSGIEITYYLEVSDVTKEDEAKNAGDVSIPFLGEKRKYKVISYKEIKGQGSENMRRVAVDFTPAQTEGMNSWAEFKLEKDESTSEKKIVTYAMSVSQQAGELSTEDAGNIALKNAAPIGTEDSPADLSTNSQNTANCYVVNAPGYYKLPLVYGNAIKNGQSNGEAYQSTNFVDYKGQSITQPYISTAFSRGTYDPAGCCLIWQDASDLINEVSLSSDRKYLQFNISKENIVQGNAIVAVRDSEGTIMWSWHIWVTDYKLGADLKPIGSVQFMPINLGWCTTNTRKQCDPREGSITIAQNEGKESQSFTVSQVGVNEVNSSGYCPFYQWGRKDPMCPSTGSGNEPRSLHYINNNYQFKISDKVDAQYSVDIPDLIKNPYVFYTSYSGGNRNINEWYNTKYDLWNINQKENKQHIQQPTDVKKTIYDPCPIGYKIPSGGNCEPLGNEYNWDAVNKGWNIPLSKENSSNDVIEQTLFISASGRWSMDVEKDGTYASTAKNINEVGTQGYYWTSVRDNYYATGCNFYPAENIDYTHPPFHAYSNRNAQSGYAVRPIKDE